MLPWVQLDSAAMPGGGGVLRLMQRGGEFSIMAGTTELMNSRLSGSEETLARLGCAVASARPGARVLVGGLGMGFTLRAALALLRDDAAVVVAELVPEVIAWAHGALAGVHGTSLSDARVSITPADVGQVIGAAKAAYDAILLDVDNGPEGLTRKANDRIYSAAGLAAAKAALRPGGVLSVWSSGPDSGFTRRLQHAGFGVVEVVARANGKRGGARHVIWLATRPAS